MTLRFFAPGEIENMGLMQLAVPCNFLAPLIETKKGCRQVS